MDFPLCLLDLKTKKDVREQIELFFSLFLFLSKYLCLIFRKFRNISHF